MDTQFNAVSHSRCKFIIKNEGFIQLPLCIVHPGLVEGEKGKAVENMNIAVNDIQPYLYSILQYSTILCCRLSISDKYTILLTAVKKFTTATT